MYYVYKVQCKYVCGTFGGMELDLDTDFPEFVKQTRTDLGLTQREAARRAGLTPDVWSRLEKGVLSNFTWEKGLKVLKGLGYHMVLTFEGPKPKPEPEPEPEPEPATHTQHTLFRTSRDRIHADA